jgi:hypothetical protein
MKATEKSLAPSLADCAMITILEPSEPLVKAAKQDELYDVLAFSLVTT